MDYILRIDMSDGKVNKAESSSDDRLLGGRGLSAKILNEEIDAGCEPLGRNNKLIIAPGLLAATMAPSFGRLSFGAKSPLTHGTKKPMRGRWVE